MTKARMLAHIEKLCSRYHVTIDWNGCMWAPDDDTRLFVRGYVYWDIRHIDLAPTFDKVPHGYGVQLYAAALHEIGHIAARGARWSSQSFRFAWVNNRVTNQALQCEIKAWRWAQRHAKVWTPEMARTKQACLADYRSRQ